MNCPTCGSEAADGAKFCADCGSSLAASCSNCGAEYAPGAKFCANCGQSLAPKADGPQRSAEERKVVSVLFADLAGFTARTETSDPEDVRARLTVYHRTVREQVEAHGGKVEKLMGDGVFAVFGVPTAHEDDPERTVRAALKIQEAVDVLNEDDSDLGLSVRIAVTTGEAIVQLDPDNRDRESIVGDVVNTASRLEAVAPPGGVVVDERTYLATRGVIEFDDLESVDLKGKADSTAIWQAAKARARQGVAVTERHKGPFVGRDRELAVLVESLQRTNTAGTVQMVTIVGEPGSGKSRLLHEFKAVLDRMPDIMWWKQGRCLPYGEGITFWALGEIVKAQAGILETDSEEDADRKLRHAVVSVIDDDAQASWVHTRLAPLASGSIDDQSVEQGELFSAWLRFFAGMAQQHLLVMVVEDIHWADESLLDFLEHLAEWAVDVPILLIAAARPELLSTRPGWGGGIRNAATITLTPLANNDAAHLLSALLERAVLPAESQQIILEKAGGNPLYVTEFVRLAEEANLLDDAGRISELGLPDSVQAIIGSRLDLLDVAEKELLQAAAVVGKVFWSGAVAALRPTSYSQAALRELMRRELIRPIRDPSMHGQEEYAFVHALVRDVAYGRLARDDRANLHQAAATWIEAMSGDRTVDVAELLAYHLGEAISLTAQPDEELRRRAYRALMQAAERAKELDVGRGVSYYRKAAKAAVDAGDRAQALLASGRIDQTNVDAAVQDLEGALELYEQVNDPEGQATAMLELSLWRWWRGDTEGSFDQVLAATKLLENRQDSAAKARAQITHVNRLSLRGLDADAVALAEQIAPLVDAYGSSEDQIRLLARTAQSRGDDGIDDLFEAIRRADEGNFSTQMVTIRNNLATFLSLLRSPVAALPILDEGIRLAKERGMTGSLEWLTLTKSELLVFAGEWSQSLELAEELIRLDDERGQSQAGKGARANREWVRFQRGADVREEWEEQLEFAREVKDQQVLAPTLALGVSIFAAERDVDQALALADEFGVSCFGIYRDAFLPYATEPLMRLGEVKRIRTLIPESGERGSAAQVGYQRARGHLALAEGDISDAVASLEGALRVALEFDRHADAAHTRVDLVAALGTNDPGFHDVLNEARAGAERLGASRLLDRLDEIEGIEPAEAARA